jgi:mRNA interferase MazF
VSELRPSRGDIWLADPARDVIGHEQIGRRPVLIVSADQFNRAAGGWWPLAVVVPLTTRDRGIALHVPIQPPEGGLRQASVLLPEQLYAADQRRLVERWGRVFEATLRQVEDRLRIVLDLA